MKTFGSTNEIRTDILLVDSGSGTVHKTWTPERNGGESRNLRKRASFHPRLRRSRNRVRSLRRSRRRWLIVHAASPRLLYPDVGG